jgi:hypothetical protein
MEPNGGADELGMGEGLCGRMRHRKDPMGNLSAIAACEQLFPNSISYDSTSVLPVIIEALDESLQ